MQRFRLLGKYKLKETEVQPHASFFEFVWW